MSNKFFAFCNIKYYNVIKGIKEGFKMNEAQKYYYEIISKIKAQGK